MAYRVAHLRQVLQLDTMPTSTSVLEFGEALQAEAEQLALMTAPTAAAPPTVPPPPKKDPVKVAALTADQPAVNVGT